MNLHYINELLTPCRNGESDFKLTACKVVNVVKSDQLLQKPQMFNGNDLNDIATKPALPTFYFVDNIESKSLVRGQNCDQR